MDTEQKQRVAEIIHATDVNSLCPIISESEYFCALVDPQHPIHQRTLDQVRTAAQQHIHQNQHDPYLKGLVVTDTDLKSIYVGLAAGLQLAYEKNLWQRNPRSHLGNAPPGYPGFCVIEYEKPEESLLVFGVQGVVEAIAKRKHSLSFTTPHQGIEITANIYPMAAGAEEGRHVAQVCVPELKSRIAEEEKRAYPQGRPDRVSRTDYPNDPREHDAEAFVVDNIREIKELSRALEIDAGRGRV